MSNLTELVTAASIAHTVHAFSEVTNVRNKLERLHKAIRGESLKPYPMKIDTRAKAYGLGLGLFVVISGIFYGIFKATDLSNDTLLTIALAGIVLPELIALVGLDKYHMTIEPLIKKFNKKG